MYKIKIKRWIWGVSTVMLLSLLFSTGCSQREDTSGEENPDGDYEWPMGDGDVGESENTGLCSEIKEPLSPELPECLQGDDPPGCAELPRLPECLQGDNPRGCAEMPRMQDWDCPSGWNSVPAFVDEDGVENVPEGMAQYTICEPPELPESCPEGFMPQLGSSDCVHIGDPCPVGDFPTVPNEITGDRIYVKAGSLGGDGDIASPFGNINDALASASSGDVIVIAEGRYKGTVEPQVDITLFGACVEKVIIDTPETQREEEAGAILIASGRKVRLFNLRISGALTGIYVMDVSSEANAKGVWIHQTTTNGIAVKQGTVHLEEVFVSDVQLNDELGVGRGIAAIDGANVTVLKSTLDNCKETGVVVTGRELEPQTQFTASDFLLRGTKTDNGGAWGDGLWIRNGAHADLLRAKIHDNKHCGVFVGLGIPGYPSKLSMTQVTVSETATSNEFGYGLFILDRAEVRIDDSIIEKNQDVGIAASDGINQVIDMSNIVISETRLGPSGEGQGVYMYNTQDVSIERALVLRNAASGIFVSEIDSFELVDIVVMDTRSDADGNDGLGLNIYNKTHVSVDHGLFEHNAYAGVEVYSEQDLDAAPVILTDITIQDSQTSENGYGIGLNIMGLVDVTVERASLLRNQGAGLLAATLADVSPPEVHAVDVLIKGTKDSGNGLGGKGIEISDGASFTLEKGVIIENEGIGIQANTTLDMQNPNVSLTDIVISGTTFLNNTGGEGRGLYAQNGAEVAVTRGLFEGNTTEAIGAGGSEGADPPKLILTDITVIDTLPNEDGLMGRGLEANRGAEVELTRGIFKNNSDVAIFSSGWKGDSQTTLTLEHVLVADTQMLPDGTSGQGIMVQTGAVVTVDAAVFTGNHQSGVVVMGWQGDPSGPKTIFNFSDVIVQDTSAREDGNYGRAMNIQSGVVAEMERVILRRNTELGLLVLMDPDNVPSEVNVSDILVQDTKRSPDGRFGRGLNVQDGANVSIVRGRFDHNNELGIYCGMGPAETPAQLELSDVTVTNTGSTADGKLGRGLEATMGCTLEASNICILDNREVGVFVFGWEGDPQTHASFTNLTVTGTLYSSCGELPKGEDGACYLQDQNLGGGHGLAAVYGGQATISDFFISGSTVAGILISREGVIEAHRGTITENAIGLNILDPDYDMSLLEDEVYNFDNTVDFARTDMPIPDPAELIGPL